MNIEAVVVIFRHNMSTLAREAAASRRSSPGGRHDDADRSVVLRSQAAICAICARTRARNAPGATKPAAA